MKEPIIKKVFIFYASKPEVRIEVVRDEYRIIPVSRKEKSFHKSLLKYGMHIESYV